MPKSPRHAPQHGQGTDTISDQLRRAIAGSGLTVYMLAKRSGVNTAPIARFLTGERDLRLDTVDRLAPVLGLRLVAEADDAEPADHG